MQPRNQDVDLDLLEPHPKNYNRHPAEQVRRLAKSLAKFGQVRSVVVWRNTLLAGHGVVEAARILNWRTVRADVLPDDYPEHLALAYIAADNELAKQGDPDMAQLAAILEESNAADADLLEAIGYSDKEFEALLAEVGKGTAGVEDAGAQVDKADELREKWQTAPGQLWQLGEHRLICGDCTDPATVARVMGGERADTLVSDPPYGIGYEYENHDDSDNSANMELIKAAWNLAPKARVWTCGLMNLARDLEWNPHAKVLVWHKGFAQAGNGLGGASTWEPVLVVDVKGATLPDDYLHFGTDRIEGLRDLHSCPKPIALFGHLIKHLAGAVVYEPFSGSGTTLLACQNLARRCRACEISPAYVAVALDRWAMSTGKTPVLVEAA